MSVKVCMYLNVFDFEIYVLGRCSVTLPSFGYQDMPVSANKKGVGDIDEGVDFDAVGAEKDKFGTDTICRLRLYCAPTLDCSKNYWFHFILCFHILDVSKLVILESQTMLV